MASTVEVLTKALELLGRNGENWNGFVGRGCGECAYTAIYLAKYGARACAPPECAESIPKLLGFSCVDEVFRWNDDENRTFPEVRAAFLKAIELAKSAAANGGPG